MSDQFEENSQLSARELMNRRERRKSRRHNGQDDLRPDTARRELASISPTHARLDYVLDSLQNMVPPDASENPMVKMFITFLREAKKDLRRLPEEFILQLSRPIGQAFMWVAEGDNEIMAGSVLFQLPEQFTSPEGFGEENTYSENESELGSDSEYDSEIEAQDPGYLEDAGVDDSEMAL